MIFNYIFFRIAKFYDKLGVKNSLYLRTVVMKGTFEALNIFAILNIFINFEISVFIVILIISAVLITMNFIRYNKESYDKFALKWENETIIEKIIYGIFVLIYMLFSIIFLIFSSYLTSD